MRQNAQLGAFLPVRWKCGATARATTSPTPGRSAVPSHGAAKDGVPTMVKLGRREFRVLRVVSTYDVHKTGEGFVGTAWKL
jgi:hypothetical protein